MNIPHGDMLLKLSGGNTEQGFPKAEMRTYCTESLKCIPHREPGYKTRAAFSQPLQEILHAQFVFVAEELAQPSA